MNKDKKIAVIICATKNFQYALIPQAKAMKQNFMMAGIVSADIIYVTCENPFNVILERVRGILGEGFTVHHLPLPVKDGFTRYKQQAQLLIAQLYTAGFDFVRNLNSDFCWLLESDVICEPNNLRCMIDMVNFDGGYYDVAFCPYISSGGGGIMGGRGDENNPIFPNIYDDERELPTALVEEIDNHKVLLEPGQEPSQQWKDEFKRLMEEIQQCPPKGNVFFLNSQRWRQRGWLEAAYPGIGKGAVLPSDWMPMGNNLFSKKALTLTDFTGYAGGGTQDLFLGFRKLKQHGIKICVIPHSVSSHVLRRDDGFKIFSLYHEPRGEYEGHLRTIESDWFSHEPGEKGKNENAESYNI